MIKITLPNMMGTYEAENMEQASLVLQGLLQEKMMNYAKRIDAIQMSACGHKQKILPEIIMIDEKEYKTKIEPNIEEKITELKISSKKDDEFSIEDLLSEAESAISEDEDGPGDDKACVYFPEPFGPIDVKDEKDAVMAVAAYGRLAMPDLTKELDSIKISNEKGINYKSMMACNIVPLSQFIKMKRIIELKTNAVETIRNHFEKNSFKVCPECRDIAKEPRLFCDRCGHSRKLNQNLDNI